MKGQGISLFSVLPFLPPSSSAWYYSLPMLSGKIREVPASEVRSSTFTSGAGEDKLLACRKMRVLPCLHPFCLLFFSASAIHCSSVSLWLHPAAVILFHLSLCLVASCAVPCSSAFRLSLQSRPCFECDMDQVAPSGLLQHKLLSGSMILTSLVSGQASGVSSVWEKFWGKLHDFLWTII